MDPSAPVREALSEPARSTKFIFEKLLLAPHSLGGAKNAATSRLRVLKCNHLRNSDSRWHFSLMNSFWQGSDLIVLAQGFGTWTPSVCP